MRKPPRYTVILYTGRKPSEGASPIATYVAGKSLDNAKRIAADLLVQHAIEATDWTWSREVAGAPFCAIRCDGRHVRFVTPTCTVVPSVRQLGWTP